MLSNFVFYTNKLLPLLLLWWETIVAVKKHYHPFENHVCWLLTCVVLVRIGWCHPRLPFWLLKPWCCWNSVDYHLSLLQWCSVPKVTVTSLVGVVTDTKHTLSWFFMLIESSFFNIICNNSKTATLAITRLSWLSPTAPYQLLCQSIALVSSEWVPRPSCLLFWVAHKSKKPSLMSQAPFRFNDAILKSLIKI